MISYQNQKNNFIRYGIITGLISGFLWSLNNLFYYNAYTDIICRFQDNTYVVNSSVLYVLLIPLLCSAINDLTAGITVTVYNYRKYLIDELLRSVNTKYGIIICLAGLIGGPLGQLSYFTGVALAGPAYSLIITAFYPIIGCILSTIILHQKMLPHMWLGIIISITGAIIIGFNPTYTNNPYFYLGIICSVIATLSWGLEIVLASLGMSLVDPNIAINIRELISGFTLAIIFILVVLSGDFSLQPASFSVLGLKPYIFLIIAGITAAFSYAFWYVTNNKLGCARGTALNSTFLIWGIILGFILGDISYLTWNLIIGSCFILIGVFLVLLNPQKSI